MYYFPYFEVPNVHRIMMEPFSKVLLSGQGLGSTEGSVVCYKITTMTTKKDVFV